MDTAIAVPGLTLGPRLGSGSSGQVFAARRDVDGWRCAVKVATVSDPATAEAVRREAAILASVRLPHLVRLHDVVDLPDNRVALILDLVDGGSVRRVVAQRGHLRPGEVVTVVSPVLNTLAQLHERGIVHADVSAGNVLLTREGRPRLADLGGARLVGERRASVTGTAGFFAPELHSGEQPTARSDVYAAGALGWQLLTGRDLPDGLLRPPLRQLVVAPEALVGVIEDCLCGDASRRPSAAEAARRYLAATEPEPVELAGGPEPTEQLTLRLAGRRPGPLRPSAVELIEAVGQPDDQSVSTSHLNRDAVARPTGTRNRWVPAVLLCAVALVLGGVFWRSTSPGLDERVQPVDDRVARPPSSVQPVVESDLVTALDALVRQRAVAFEQAQPGLLGRVYLPGSDLWRCDVQRVNQLIATRVRYRGLRYVIAEASPPFGNADQMHVRVRIDTNPYVVVDATGRRRPSPGEPGTATVVTVRRTPSGWRIASLGRT